MEEKMEFYMEDALRDKHKQLNRTKSKKSRW